MKKLLFVLLFLIGTVSFGQTVEGLINQVSKDGVVQMVRDLSGEDKCIVGGKEVTITHRVSAKGNDLALDYIVEKFKSYGLDATTIDYSSKGRNIVAKQVGVVNPDNIYIICAHYDAVANHGADDNASGTTAVLESARILSNYKFENTIIYALWDEEETGLNGAKNYANTAKNNKDNILAVLNMDMIGYDGDNDKLFDIDVRDIANSYEIRDDLKNVVSKYSIDLVSAVVDPGTPDSDHSAFWNAGYSAALFGEAWSKDDVTPGYHKDTDRIDLFNIDYFYKMVKVCVGYITTKGVLVKDTGIEELDKPLYTAAPNPVNDLITISLGGKAKGELEVLNLYGEKVLSQTFNGEQIVVKTNGWASGMYIFIFSIKNKAGSISQLKVVKE